MDLNERYERTKEEIDEHLKNKPCFINNKISYKETCAEVDEFFNII